MIKVVERKGSVKRKMGKQPMADILSKSL